MKKRAQIAIGRNESITIHAGADIEVYIYCDDDGIVEVTSNANSTSINSFTDGSKVVSLM